MRIDITIEGQRFEATLDDSAASRDLLAQLPQTVKMRDHGGVEKTGPLRSALSLEGQPSGADPSVGDVGYLRPRQRLRPLLRRPVLLRRNRQRGRNGSPAASDRATADRPSARPRRIAPGARTAWHHHPKGQTLYVTDGIGLVATRSGEVQEIRPGDVVYIEPGEEHWHGATSDRFMAHVAMQEADENGDVVTWLEHVTDKEYGI